MFKKTAQHCISLIFKLIQVVILKIVESGKNLYLGKQKFGAVLFV